MSGARDGGRALSPRRVQWRLIQLYGLSEDLPDVTRFLQPSNDRERVLVREQADALEISVELPRRALDGPGDLDELCQVVEGVSHFVLLVERARRALPTSQLELELQAELDKFALLATLDTQPASRSRFVALHRRLFDDATFRDPEGTELGDRYRLAHRLAARLCWRLGREHLHARHPRQAVDTTALLRSLRAFYHLGPTEKVARAEAA